MGFLPEMLLGAMPPPPAVPSVGTMPMAPPCCTSARTVLSLEGALPADPTAFHMPAPCGLAQFAPSMPAEPLPHYADFLNTQLELHPSAQDWSQGFCAQPISSSELPRFPAPAQDGALRPAEELALKPAPVTARPPTPPPGPAPGSAELPSLGSAGHAAGSCKPCAFMHTRGCSSGPACKFCHLCGPEEVKLRRKQKIQQLREISRARKEGQPATSSETA